MTMKTNKISMVGFYEPMKVKKGVNETTLPLKEGQIFWLIKTEYGGFDTERQEDAEIISRLVRIEQMLKKIIKKNESN